MIPAYNGNEGLNMVCTVSIGITAYNEEKAMPRLLRSVLSQITPSGYEIVEIIIVSSGSTDQTNQIVSEFQAKDSRINLIVEPVKRGKPAALNLILSSFKGDILILSGADCVYKANALFYMLKDFDDASVSAVSGYPVPLNSRNSLWGFSAHAFWDIHHYMSLQFNNKLTGELCALRSAFVVNVPEVGGDDVFLERSIIQKGGKIKYEPSSITHILGPQTAMDYFKQWRRVMGHIKNAEIKTQIKGTTTNYLEIIRVLMSNLHSLFSLRLIPVMIVALCQDYGFSLT